MRLECFNPVVERFEMYIREASEMKRWYCEEMRGLFPHPYPNPCHLKRMHEELEFNCRVMQKEIDEFIEQFLRKWKEI